MVKFSMSEKEIGKIVVTLRHEQGLTIEELANKANVSRSQLYYLETGKRNITFRTVNKVVNALGYDILKPLKK